ncbi:MAG: DcrB-related protein [candidate division Zixibacteria bacterium]|jgi:hypothetical protein|nr:DcrB-related protein [candidate division Zixibacteria bacterium]
MNDRLAFDLPGGWQDQTVYRFKGPDDGDTEHAVTLVVDREAGDTPADRYTRVRIDTALETLQPSETVKDEAITLSNGMAAYEAVLKWVPVDDQVIFHKMVYVVRNGIGYTFTGNFTKKTIKTVALDMDRLITSILS